MLEKLLLGSVVLFVLFLKRTKSEAKQVRPIFQKNSLGKYESLRPYIDAQAIHETGNYSSPLALEANNLFGMKRPNKRPFLGIGETNSGYAKYSSWSDAVADLLVWMDATSFPVNVSGSAQYAEELKKRRYFEDSLITYIKGINRGLADLSQKGVTGFKINFL